jgi:hypothetical protein
MGARAVGGRGEITMSQVRDFEVDHAEMARCLSQHKVEQLARLCLDADWLLGQIRAETSEELFAQLAQKERAALLSRLEEVSTAINSLQVTVLRISA